MSGQTMDGQHGTGHHRTGADQRSDGSVMDNPDAAPFPEVRYLGSRFHLADQAAVEEAILHWNGPFQYVVTPNVQHVVNMQNDTSGLTELYNRAWLSLCDGRFLPLLARFSGLTLPSVSGSDLTESLVPRLAKEGVRAVTIGPQPEDVEALRQRYPGLQVEGHTPPFGFLKKEEEIQACVDFVASRQAQVVFLAVGTPRQEVLADRMARDPRIRGVGLCCGASIDFLVGRQNRAPLWMQKYYLEWFHRLMSDPKRLARRYLIEGPRIFAIAARYELGRRRRGDRRDDGATTSTGGSNRA